MKFLKLRLRNFRGIKDFSADFNSSGINVIEGPNEVGKSSLADAIMLLFNYRASSKHRDIKEIKPVNIDVGTEIELQAESGPYAFTYSKRFHKNTMTTLKLTAPRPENYAGDEAHEKAEAILGETIDVNLWRALNIRQGLELSQADLTKQTALSAALDRAAGGNTLETKTESLFALVQNEYSLYYTGTGKANKLLRESTQAVDSAEEALKSTSDVWQSLENDIDEVPRLNNECESLEIQAKEIKKSITEHQAALKEIREWENKLDKARIQLDADSTLKNETSKKQETRQKLIGKVQTTLDELDKLKETAAARAPALEQATKAWQTAEKNWHSIDDERKTAESLLALRRADVGYFRNKFDLEQMRERQERLEKGRTDKEAAETELQRYRVDDKKLNTIVEAREAVVRAEAKLEAETPTITLRGLARTELVIDGKNTSIEKEEEKQLSVTQSLRLTIPKQIDIKINSGISTDAPAQHVSAAQAKFETACRAGGVANLEEAKAAYEKRRQAQAKIENWSRIATENLRDLTEEEFAGKLKSLEKNVDNYTAMRATVPSLADSYKNAEDELLLEEKIFNRINKRWTEVHARLEAARKNHEDLRSGNKELQVELRLKEDAYKQLLADIDRARDSITDKDLEIKAKETAENLALTEKDFNDIENKLKEKNPEKVKTLLNAAEGSSRTLQQRRDDIERRLITTKERLRLRGEEGIYEKLKADETRLEQLKRENEALVRRALAVELLFTTMRDERDKSRQAYVAPLKNKIEQLGKVLFNNSFNVEVDEELRITKRTLDGITVPFTSLSSGAKEQLSLMTRLACMMLVGKESDGAPLILDDALGYTDPERLKLMGAVIAEAGRHGQIIILTCMPERYSNVGEANVIRL